MIVNMVSNDGTSTAVICSAKAINIVCVVFLSFLFFSAFLCHHRRHGRLGGECGAEWSLIEIWNDKPHSGRPLLKRGYKHMRYINTPLHSMLLHKAGMMVALHPYQHQPSSSTINRRSSYTLCITYLLPILLR